MSYSKLQVYLMAMVDVARGGYGGMFSSFRGTEGDRTYKNIKHKRGKKHGKRI